MPMMFLIMTETCFGQFPSRWRDQRAPGTRAVQFLNIFAANSNPALLYQGVVRPQLELQQQVQSQQRSIDRLTPSSLSPNVMNRPGDDRQNTSLGTIDRTGLTTRRATAVGMNAGHPTYFLRREPYFLRFRTMSRNDR
jgi:hypothetical protein